MSLATTGAIVGIAGTAYGAYQSSQMAGQAAKDPFGKGNRKFYQRQLKDLITHPESILTSAPFKSALDLGLTSVHKMMAAQGFLGSGNEAAALMKYGETFGLDWLRTQEQTLAQLAGSGMQPSYGAAVGGTQVAGQMWDDAMSQAGALGQRLLTQNRPGPPGFTLDNYPVTPNVDLGWIQPPQLP